MKQLMRKTREKKKNVENRFPNVLDVGSGIPSKWHKFAIGKNIVHIDVDKTGFHLENNCSVYCLPFVDRCFDVVYASHLLEHLINPVQAVEELRRVAKKTVIIKVPNASFFKLRPSSHKGDHLFSWNEWTLKALLDRFFLQVVISGSSRRAFLDLPATRFRKVKWIFERVLFGSPELTAICQC